MDSGYLALFIPLQRFRRGFIPAGILSEHLGRLRLPVIRLLHLRPLWPRIILPPGQRKLRHDFQLSHTLTALTDGRSDAVGSRVSAADNHDMLIFSR
ncbi:hypothetical protein D3C81_756980 [compost metagenome]